MTPEVEAAVKELWENHPELSADKISSMYGRVFSKNVVIAVARRRGWKPRGAQQKQELAAMSEDVRAARNRIRSGKISWKVRSWLQRCGFDHCAKLTVQDLNQLPQLTDDEEKEYPFERTTFGRLAALHADMDAVLEHYGGKHEKASPV